ncbi:magnesium and cobalt transport protein CorA [Methanococcus vannielii SB]|uniref:Magnesium transport protein CorA n=1 Tax=Methanococcus vannielii (strain ATCC 35089 / DSM 1224 / JCM 13029 / OCM 148 / SB) TaxID=406327 RepID=A6USK7_METVS|nr:magnesium/cobalt transporter CorA [Methanococcus vannielii]ABR55479.1 magnesium and cobalt transport protein CorA [Methanococcus vannielii SB]
MKRVTKQYSKKVGTPPGELIYTGEVRPKESEIVLVSFDKGSFSKNTVLNIDELKNLDKNRVNWIIFYGFHEPEGLKTLGNIFEIHKLTLEDILNTSQRTKFEVYEKYKYFVTSLVEQNKFTKNIDSEQLSVVLKENVLITFFENDTKLANRLIERIENKKGSIWAKKMDYLFYGLLDSIIDRYFEIISYIEDEIEKCDEKVFSEIDPKEIVRIRRLRQILVILRKQVGPLREIFHKFSRDDFEFIEKGTLIYIRDLYDHTVHLIETIDVLKDNTSSIAEIHLSVMSNNMNEVMKVLTIISTIFIPLSFVAGLYGMNFENMPELKLPFGYYYILILMALMISVMLLFFRRKKWI